MPDVIANPTIDLAQLIADVGKIKDQIGSIEGSTKKADKALSSIGTSIRTAIGAGVALKAFGDVNNALGQMDRKAGDLDESFVAFGESSMTAANRTRLAWGKALGSIADTASFGLTKRWTQAAEKDLTDFQRVARELQTKAESPEALGGKLQNLQNLKTTETAKKFDDRDQKALANIEIQINETTSAIVAQAEAQSALQRNVSVGSQQQIALNEIEIAQAQKKADLDNKFRQQFGTKRTSKDLESLQAQKDVVDAIAERQKNLVKLSLMEEQRQFFLTEQATKTGIEYEDHHGLLEDQLREINRLIQSSKDLGLQGTLRHKQLEMQRHEILLQEEAMNHAKQKEIRDASLTTAAMNSELTESTQLAEMAKIRANYETQILEALRQGNPELAAQLRNQQAIANAGAAVNRGLQGPQQQREAAQLQAKKDHEVRQENNRQKLHAEEQQKVRDKIARGAPVSAAEIKDAFGRGNKDATGRFHVSPSAAKAAREIAERAARAPLPKALANREQAVNNFNAANAVFKEIRCPN